MIRFDTVSSNRLLPLDLQYPPQVRQAIQQAAAGLVTDYDYSRPMARWLAIQFISQNKVVREYATRHRLATLVNQQTAFDKAGLADQLFATRLTFIEQTLQAARHSIAGRPHTQLTSRIDQVVTHPVLGLPIFALIFFLMFKISFDWVGTPLSNLLDHFLSGPVSTTANRLLIQAGTIPALRSLVVNGIIAGVGGVLTFIFAGTVLIWVLSSFGTTGFVTDSTQSFAAGLGRALIPVFQPLGIGQWQAISALFTGILAKEVITASMMVMFHTSSKAVLVAALGQFVSSVAAYALLVFILLYAPCFATLTTIKQETGSAKWMFYSAFSSLVIAYLVALLAFKFGSLIF